MLFSGFVHNNNNNNNNNNLLFIHTLLNLNRNSKVRAVSSSRTFSTPILWHDLIHTLLGAKSSSVTSWAARRCPGLYNVKILCVSPPPGAPSKFSTPPRPALGRPRPTCKVSALYLENCANALRQKDRQRQTDRQTILFIDIDCRLVPYWREFLGVSWSRTQSGLPCKHIG